jgi:hypothetical protein
MGLMDNIKTAQEMAKQAQEAAAQQGAGGAPGMPGMDVAAMQQTQRIAQQGLDGTCEIKAISETGNVDAGGAKEFKIDCEASIGGDSYQATAMQHLHPGAIDAYQVGKKFEIKADPEDKTKILLMGGMS